MPSLCRDCGDLSRDDRVSCGHCGGTRLVAHPELDELAIAHIDCDAFYASVEKRDNPALAERAVIVGHPGGRGVVTTACYIARRFGVHSAMPMFKAQELCPEAVVIPPDMAKYKEASARIRALFLKSTPFVEPVSLDEAYLDLSPKARLIDRPPAMLLARLARAIERDVGVSVSVGLSYNKFLAKTASDLDKPRGFSIIGRMEAVDLLAPMPVRAIHGIGAATARKMAESGLTQVSQLQAMPEDALVARFGKFGRALAHLVRGEDPRPVNPDRPRRSLSRETTFRQDLRSYDVLAQALEQLAVGVEAQLRRAGLAGETVVLKLKTADFQSLSRQSRLSTATQRADVIAEHGLRLLRREVDGRAFRLIGIGVDHIVPEDRADPPDLFADRKTPFTAP